MDFFFIARCIYWSLYIFMKGESSATPSHAPYMFCGDGCKTVTVGAKQLTGIFPCLVIAWSFYFIFFTDFCVWANLSVGTWPTFDGRAIDYYYYLFSLITVARSVQKRCIKHASSCVIFSVLHMEWWGKGDNSTTLLWEITFALFCICETNLFFL